MAIGDNFMWFSTDAGIPGETEDMYFKGKKAFEVLNFSFTVAREKEDIATKDTGSQTAKGLDLAGSSRPKPGGPTSGGFTGLKPKLNGVEITKTVDTASVKLYRACMKGTRFATIMLAIRRSGGAPMLYLQYIFRDSVITGVTWSGGSGTTRTEEKFTILFKGLGMQYVPQRPDGTPGVGDSYSFNIEDGTETLVFGKTAVAPTPAYEDVTPPTPSGKVGG